MLLLTSMTALSAFAYEPDVTQGRMEFDQSAAEDSLVPTGSRKPEGPPLYYLAKFGRYPSFSDAFEWAISLEKGKYVLRSWRLERDEKGVYRPRRAETIGIELSRELAQAAYTLWSNAILDARYSRAGFGLDGTSYGFSTWLRGIGFPSAMTWSPSKDLPPRWMVEAGEALLTYGRAKERDSAAILAKLQAISNRSSAYRQRSGPQNRPNKSLERTRDK